jgi:hypothetical protein
MYSGYSWTTFDDLTLHLLQQIAPSRILDIGAGEGKYGSLIRSAGWGDVHLTAVEYEPLRRDELLAIGYNEVRSISALDLMKSPAETFEVVILGDVIEHFRKSEGQDLLEYLNYRASYIFVITPENMPMSLANFYEGHNSMWRPQAMQWHDLWAHCRDGQMHFYLMRGMLTGGGKALLSLVNTANAQAFMHQKSGPNQRGQVRNLSVHDTRSTDPDAEIPGTVWVYRPD